MYFWKGRICGLPTSYQPSSSVMDLRLLKGRQSVTGDRWPAAECIFLVWFALILFVTEKTMYLNYLRISHMTAPELASSRQ